MPCNDLDKMRFNAIYTLCVPSMGIFNLSKDK